MIADVKRAYVPRCDSLRAAFQQKSIANIQAFTGSLGTYPNNLLSLALNPSYNHRKVWAYIFSVSATWSIDLDLVFFLQQSEIYRQKIIVWSSAGANNQFSMGFSLSSTQVAIANETLTTLIANTAVYTASPHRFNIAADRACLDVKSITGGAALFDGLLMIQSQAGL